LVLPVGPAGGNQQFQAVRFTNRNVSLNIWLSDSYNVLLVVFRLINYQTTRFKSRHSWT